jgi:hypothetical protein
LPLPDFQIVADPPLFFAASVLKNCLPLTEVRENDDCCSGKLFRSVTSVRKNGFHMRFFNCVASDALIIEGNFLVG